eukprot:Plantae.Rhodophyta-Purpureofilum_apyrenoidigerum.ctg8001.p1 GENE.Plantae.Rhodophyta-Purpureofilum_apyrenoidigerum.ctg8001~~Plantae.Rhodophyta-Purpureofilum_apyrenoidigerum.ctg8001.p1  ORF type:complete len:264 (+),score=37.27 Plantae.Rhodophyta-Purpureofilum_apyrenoidigerum.ctg8001:158-949(+)
MTSCCPPGSWSALEPEDGDFSGKIETINDDMKCYVVGPKDGSSDKGILFLTDIFDYVGGRNKGIAEQLASEGYTIFIPDLSRGDYFTGDLNNTEEFGAWCKKFGYDVVGKDIKQLVLPFIKSKDIAKLGIISFCYGGFISTHLCSDPDTLSEFKVAVNNHCSIVLHHFFFGGDDDCCDLAQKVRVPSIYLVAKNDPDFMKEGGATRKCLKSIPDVGPKCNFFDFPNQMHAWTNRGDVSDPEVADGVKQAMNIAFAAFKEHLCS